MSWICFLFFAISLNPDQKLVQATVRMDPDHHYYLVEMVFPKRKLIRRELNMAVWTPGSYKVRDFARNVEQFEAFDLSGNPLHWSKTGKTTWVVAALEDKPFKVTFSVFAYEHTVRTSYLDSFYGFINPASVFVYEPSPDPLAYEVQVIPPDGWNAASSLPKTGPNTFRADNWDMLVDAPFQFGPFRRHDFDVRGIAHHWIIAGDVNMNETEMVNALIKIGEAVGDIFGGYPFSKYYFFSQFRLDGAGGGLEHRNATMVQSDSNQFRDKKGWDRFLGLMIHEYFHAWNVKAIHDKSLGPFDYQKENYTDLLWLHEGWTSYYGSLLMVRAGFWDDKELRKAFARSIDRYLQTPGIYYQSLADASFNAWIHQYQPNQAHPNSRVSYYQAGAMSGLALDLLIRHKTKNRYGLDEIMLRLYRDFAQQGKGIRWEDVVEIADQIAGKSAREFFNLHVGQATPLPLETCLGYAGLKMEYVDEDDDDKGDDSEKKETKDKPYDSNPKVTLGITVRKEGRALLVDTVKRDGNGWRAGLDFGDEILAVNERRVTAENYEEILGWSRPGDEVTVLVSRADKILSLSLKLEEKPKTLKLVRDEEAGDLQNSIYDSLFKNTAAPLAAN